MRKKLLCFKHWEWENSRGTLLQAAILSAVLPDIKILLFFFLNNKVYALQNSVTFRFLKRGGLKLKLQRTIFLWVKNREVVYIIVRAWTKHMLLTGRKTNKYLQIINTSPTFYFQIQSSHNLSSIVLLFLHWALVCGPWQEHHVFLSSPVFSPVTPVLSCLNHADACLQRGFYTASSEYIVIFKVYWGHVTSLWVSRLLKSLPQFLSMLRNFF